MVRFQKKNLDTARVLHTVSERAKHASVSPLRVKGARFIFAGTYRNAMHKEMIRITDQNRRSACASGGEGVARALKR